MNKIFKLALVLFLICAVTAGVLGGVYVLTKDKIELENIKKTETAYRNVLPAYSADIAEEVEFDKTAFPTVNKISACGDSYVVESTFSGAQGSITMAVGVDSNYCCTGISIISHSETSGLGAVAASSSEKGVAFRAQFVGEDGNIALSKKGGNIDALTGATITSTAVTNAVATSIAAVESLG